MEREITKERARLLIGGMLELSPKWQRPLIKLLAKIIGKTPKIEIEPNIKTKRIN